MASFKHNVADETADPASSMEQALPNLCSTIPARTTSKKAPSRNQGTSFKYGASNSRNASIDSETGTPFEVDTLCKPEFACQVAPPYQAIYASVEPLSVDSNTAKSFPAINPFDPSNFCTVNGPSNPSSFAGAYGSSRFLPSSLLLKNVLNVDELAVPLNPHSPIDGFSLNILVSGILQHPVSQIWYFHRYFVVDTLADAEMKKEKKNLELLYLDPNYLYKLSDRKRDMYQQLYCKPVAADNNSSSCSSSSSSSSDVDTYGVRPADASTGWSGAQQVFGELLANCLNGDYKFLNPETIELLEKILKRLSVGETSATTKTTDTTAAPFSPENGSNGTTVASKNRTKMGLNKINRRPKSDGFVLLTRELHFSKFFDARVKAGGYGSNKKVKSKLEKARQKKLNDPGESTKSGETLETTTVASEDSEISSLDCIEASSGNSGASDGSSLEAGDCEFEKTAVNANGDADSKSLFPFGVGDDNEPGNISSEKADADTKPESETIKAQEDGQQRRHNLSNLEETNGRNAKSTSKTTPNNSTTDYFSLPIITVDPFVSSMPMPVTPRDILDPEHNTIGIPFPLTKKPALRIIGEPSAYGHPPINPLRYVTAQFTTISSPRSSVSADSVRTPDEKYNVCNTCSARNPTHARKVHGFTTKHRLGCPDTTESPKRLDVHRWGKKSIYDEVNAKRKKIKSQGLLAYDNRISVNWNYFVKKYNPALRDYTENSERLSESGSQLYPWEGIWS